MKRYRAVLESTSGLLLGGVLRHEYTETDAYLDAVTLRDVGFGIESQAGRKVRGFIEVKMGRGAKWTRLLHSEVDNG